MRGGRGEMDGGGGCGQEWEEVMGVVGGGVVGVVVMGVGWC